VLTGDQVEAAWGALDRQVRSGDAQKLQGVEPTPKSVGQMTGTAMLTATAAALGFLASPRPGCSGSPARSRPGPPGP